MRSRASWSAVAGCIGAVLMFGCGSDSGPSDSVYTRVRPDADFSSYHTFALVTSPDDLPDLPDPPELPGDLPDDLEMSLEITQNAVREQMELLGLEEVEVDENPDLYVLDFAATQDQDAIYWECVPGWYWWGWYWYWDPCAWLRPIPVTVTLGSVLVMLVDPDIEPSGDYGRVVFGGLLQGVADGSGNVQQRIEAGVERMFRDYPSE